MQLDNKLGFGKAFGYIAGYFLFTTVLYFILSYKFERLSYLNTGFISVIITFVGVSLRRFLG